MALFKILSGKSDNFNIDVSGESTSPAFNEGYCYFIKDNQKLYIDWLDGKEKKRTALVGEKLVIELNENNLDNDLSNDDGTYFNIKNIQTLIKEAKNKNIPIELHCYDLFIFNSLTYYGSINNIDVYITNTIYDALLSEQFITISIYVQNDNIILFSSAIEFNAMAKISDKGKIAVYGDNQIEGKDLWYSLHLTSGDGVFECSNTEMDNFVTSDNVDSIKVSLEFDEENTKDLTVKERFEQRKAFQKADFSVSVGTGGIAIIDNNQELKYLKVSLLVDNTITQILT